MPSRPIPDIVPARRHSPLLLLSLLALSACSDTAVTLRRPNIVLISIDSLRADHLGLYGYSRATSPALDSLASESVVYENAFSTTTWTLPSHLTMLTGLLADVHGVTWHDRSLNPEAELLPELLAELGYRSEAVVSGIYLDRRFGYDQGWERWDDEILGVGPERTSILAANRAVTSERVHEKAVAALDRLAGGPFFLFLHYWDVHYDYLAPPPYDRMFDPDYDGIVEPHDFISNPAVHAAMPERDLEHLVALYDGEIRWVDDWLGRLFAELRRRGLYDEALILVTADHGEEFFEHGFKGHQQNLFDTTLRVPLVVRLPKSRFAGTTIRTPVSLVDVTPTLAALVGVERRIAWSGRSILPLRRGGIDELESVDLFAELRGRHQALLRHRWKLLAMRDEQELRPELGVALFDRAADPGERVDLTASRRRFAARLFIDLRRALEERAAASRAFAPGRTEFDANLERELRALGYL